MKKGIIIYQSKYGATKQYADWLGELTGFACAEASKAVWNEAAQYEILILCGGLYASGIAGLTVLKKKIGSLREKKIFILCVGASPYDEHAFRQIKAHNLTGELKDIPLFYGRGAWDESKMNFKDRSLCRLLQKSLSKKDPSTYEPWMEALMCAAGQRYDWTDKKYLEPLLEELGKACRGEDKAN